MADASKRGSSGRAARSAAATEGPPPWTAQGDFMTVLQNGLRVIWKAQSDVTREEKASEMASEFHRIFEDALTVLQCAELGKKIWESCASIILMGAALKVPNQPWLERSQYTKTLHAMADLMCQLSEHESATLWSAKCVKFVMSCFAENLSAGQWETRYRVLQFISFFLLKVSALEEDPRVFSAVADEDARRDGLKREIFIRAFDVKDKVAALAVEAIGHYQYEKEPAQSTKAFGILLNKMQHHSSPLVRSAAVKVIYVCTSSASALIRRVLDNNWEVRVTTYEVISEYLSPKIIHHKLRAFILLSGLNHEKGQVRSAALQCLQKWLAMCDGDYEGLIGDVSVSTPENKLFSSRQLGFDVFDQPKASGGAETPTQPSAEGSSVAPSIVATSSS